MKIPTNTWFCWNVKPPNPKTKPQCRLPWKIFNLSESSKTSTYKTNIPKHETKLTQNWSCGFPHILLMHANAFFFAIQRSGHQCLTYLRRSRTADKEIWRAQKLGFLVFGDFLVFVFLVIFWFLVFGDFLDFLESLGAKPTVDQCTYTAVRFALCLWSFLFFEKWTQDIKSEVRGEKWEEWHSLLIAYGNETIAYGHEAELGFVTCPNKQISQWTLRHLGVRAGRHADL